MRLILLHHRPFTVISSQLLASTANGSLYQSTRSQSTTTASIVKRQTNSAAGDAEIEKCYARLDRSFTNTKEAFKSKTNSELLRAIVVLRMCGINFLVQHNNSLMAALKRIVGRRLFDRLQKSTFYGHFVAGETNDEVKPVLTRLNQAGINSILFYSVEADLSVNEEKSGSTEADEKFYDKNRDIFNESVDVVADTTKAHGFAAIKITALGRPSLLLKVSDMFSKIDFHSDQLVDINGWNKPREKMFKAINVKSGDVRPLDHQLTTAEEDEFRKVIQRSIEIGEYCKKRNVRLMVDAEQTYFQPAITRIAVEMMRGCNTERTYIFNTYQAYLKNTFRAIEYDMQLARREGWRFGAKLVRGAYIEQERQRAAAMGYEDPVNVNFDATSRSYERCLTRLVDEHLERRMSNIMVAGHNEETVRFAVDLMRDRGIVPSERIMCFAQLYGMCDQVSYSLGQAGYSVYKCCPYGPVEDVLPYLGRRAIENGHILKKASKERTDKHGQVAKYCIGKMKSLDPAANLLIIDLLWSELKRRIFSGQFTYKVPISAPTA